MENNILFINSFQRSGSTLLGMLLGVQENISYVGESRNLGFHLRNDSECYCNNTINNCPYWSKIINELEIDKNKIETDLNKQKGFYFFKTLSLLNPLVRIFLSSNTRKLTKFGNTLGNILRIYDLVGKGGDKELIVDSSHRTEHMKLLYALYPQRVKVIYLVRDGRAVVNSVLKRQNSTIAREAKRWARFHKFCNLAHQGISKNDLLFVRYEDLCTNTEGVLNRIGDFINQPMLLPENFDNDNIHFIGGSPTLKKMKLNEIKLDEAWKEKWTEKDRAEFDKNAGGLNEKFGYKND